jgi:hypothetical protein
MGLALNLGATLDNLLLNLETGQEVADSPRLSAALDGPGGLKPQVDKSGDR